METKGMQRMSPIRIHIKDHTWIGPTEECFIIAEIGQNHQGDIGIAKEMILAAKASGANCVKFQKSHLPSMFNKKALLRTYNSPNSWGDTYEAHKSFLEFSENEFIELQNFAYKHNILFSSSAMDMEALKFLNSIDIPFIKIGSGNVCNKPLLKQALNLKKPLIVSTGMANMSEVIDAYNFLKKGHLNFCLLHCVSSYPVPFEEVNLNVISTFKEIFPDINIGYSGHELGIDIPLAAVALGAKVIEKHFTLNKTWKGTDHVCSLTPSEFKEMVFNIRQLEAGNFDIENVFCQETVKKALGGHEKKFQNSEYPCYKKLGKTVVATLDLCKGDIVTWENICLKVAEPKGVPAKDIVSIIGKTVKREIQADESISEDDLNH